MTASCLGYSGVMRDIGDVCATCGGDGYIENAGSRNRCPTCRGGGRRVADEGFHDVTKTKAAHHVPSNLKGSPAPKPTWPTTALAGLLATEVRDSPSLSPEVKERLIREIMEHEISHGHLTQTFTKKLRKQVRPKG